MRHLLIACLALALVADATASPTPTSHADARWMSFVGCWTLDRRDEPLDARLCVVPGEAGAVRLLTLAGDHVADETTLVADGQPRPVDDPACVGTDTATWSTSGARLFRHASVACGDETPRTVSGVWFKTTDRRFVEVLAVDADDVRSVRTRRYTRARSDGLPEGIGLPPDSPFTDLVGILPRVARWSVPEVVEASSKLPPEAVQAALVDVGAGFALDRRALRTLAAADVDEGTIDLMIALSYPERFDVSRAGGRAGTDFREWPSVDELIDLAGAHGGVDLGPFGFGPFGFGTAYWATCLGWYGCGEYWPYAAYHDPYAHRGGGGWVVVSPGPSEPGPPPREGRVVKGFGYTQVSVRQDPPVGQQATAGAGGVASSTSASSASGGQASPQGYSSGASGESSGSATPRTAQPRPPG